MNNFHRTVLLSKGKKERYFTPNKDGEISASKEACAMFKDPEKRPMIANYIVFTHLRSMQHHPKQLVPHIRSEVGRDFA